MGDAHLSRAEHVKGTAAAYERFAKPKQNFCSTPQELQQSGRDREFVIVLQAVGPPSDFLPISIRTSLYVSLPSIYKNTPYHLLCYPRISQDLHFEVTLIFSIQPFFNEDSTLPTVSGTETVLSS